MLYHRLIAVSVAACFGAPMALANPSGGVVVRGQVLPFVSNGNALTITSQSNAIINWQKFSIGANEITRFVQPSAANAILNRVVGTAGANGALKIDPSEILGTLQSNGRVFLINPSGILFGAGARIDVAGLIASTLNLSDQDFLDGRLRFTERPGAGSVVNRGAITTPGGGHVYLIAPNVENHGVITSPQGEIMLAAGRSVELVESATPNLRVQIDAPDNQVLNVGQIIANSGKVGIYAGLVRTSGEVRADGVVVGAKGEILLKATRNITVDAGAVLSANGAAGGGNITLETGDTALVSGAITATAADASGGYIRVLGNQVGVIDRAVIDASGGAGGGTVLVGGGFQGKDAEIKNARAVYFGNQATVKADATKQGNGGTIILWSDDVMRAFGAITARGGPLGGNGGFVEVSGKQWLDFRATADTYAPQGKIGTLLLDPKDIDVNDSGGSAYGGNNLFADNFGGASVILATGAGSISAQSSNVLLQADNDITFSSPVSISNAGTTLTAQAGRSIIINADVSTTNADITLTANEPTGNGVFAPHRDPGSGGISMATGVTVNAGSGNIFLKVGDGSGHAGTTTASDISLERLNGANVSIINDNPNSGSNILRNSGGSLVSASNSVFIELESAVGVSDSIGTAVAPIRIDAPILEAHYHFAGGGIFIASPNPRDLQIGGVPLSIFSGNVRGVQTGSTAGGPISIAVNGNLTHFAGAAGCGPTGGTGGPICVGGPGGPITLSAASSLGGFGNPMDVDPGGGGVSATATSGNIFLKQLSGNLLTRNYTLSAGGVGQTISLATSDGGITVDTAFNINTADDNFVLTAQGVAKDIAFSGGITLTAASAALTASGGITSGAAAVDIDTSAANGGVSLTASSGAIGSIPNPLAVRTGMGALTAATAGAGAAGDISVTAPSTLRLGMLTTAAGTSQTVTAISTGGGSDLVLTASPVLNDTVTLNAAQDLDFNGQVLATGAGTTATLTAGRDVLLRGGITDTAGALTVNLTPVGGVRTPAASTFTLNGAGASLILVVNNAKVWDNDGTVNLQGVSTISLPNMAGYATFSNNAGATFNTSSTAGWSFLSDPGVQGGIVNNAGIFNVTNGTGWEAAFSNLGTGTLNLGAGNLVSMQNGKALAGTVNIGAGATLWVSERHGANTAFNSTTMGGTGTLLVQAGIGPVADITMVNAPGITLQVNAGGTANILGGTSTFGGLSVAGGSTFLLDNSTFVQAAGNLTLPAAGTYVGNVGYTASGGNIIFNGGTAVGGSSLTLAGSGSAQFSAGVVNLNSPVTANLPVAVAGGTVNLNGATNTFNSGGSLSSGTMNLSATTNITSGLFDVTGGTFNAGAGTVNVGGTFHAGGGTINAGTMNVNAGGLLYGGGNVTGNVVNNGTVAPGDSPGTLTISGNYTQGAGGTLSSQLGGNTPGLYDVLNVTGAATLDGTLLLTLVGGYTGNVGDLYTLINAGTLSGTFASLTVPAGYTFTPAYVPTRLDVTLNVSPFGSGSGSGSGVHASASEFTQDLVREIDRTKLALPEPKKNDDDADVDAHDFMCRE